MEEGADGEKEQHVIKKKFADEIDSR